MTDRCSRSCLVSVRPRQRPLSGKIVFLFHPLFFWFDLIFKKNTSFGHSVTDWMHPLFTHPGDVNNWNPGALLLFFPTHGNWLITVTPSFALWLLIEPLPPSPVVAASLFFDILSYWLRVKHTYVRYLIIFGSTLQNGVVFIVVRCGLNTSLCFSRPHW